MPRYADKGYYKVNTGDIVGLEDYIYNLISEGETFRVDKPIDLRPFEADDYGRRRFNLLCEKDSTLMRFNIFDFQKMLIEFAEFGQKLIEGQVKQCKFLLERKSEFAMRLEGKTLQQVSL